jgi:hypothetical protein
MLAQSCDLFSPPGQASALTSPSLSSLASKLDCRSHSRDK